MARNQRGLTEAQEHFHTQAIRDTRTMGMRIADTLHSPIGASVCIAVSMLLCWFIPALFDVLFAVSIYIFYFCFFQKSRLPFRSEKFK